MNRLTNEIHTHAHQEKKNKTKYETQFNAIISMIWIDILLIFFFSCIKCKWSARPKHKQNRIELK